MTYGAKNGATAEIKKMMTRVTSCPSIADPGIRTQNLSFTKAVLYH